MQVGRGGGRLRGLAGRHEVEAHEFEVTIRADDDVGGPEVAV
ncbi:MAG: hypothetical protein ABIQ26_00750 [Streptosporangiaceae bacterium]